MLVKGMELRITQSDKSLFPSRRQAFAAAKITLSSFILFVTANIPASKAVNLPIFPCFFQGSPVDGVVEEVDSSPEIVPARRIFDFKAVMHFFVRGDPIFLVEDDHCGDKDWCQFC